MRGQTPRPGALGAGRRGEPVRQGMGLRIVPGTANPSLAHAIATALRTVPVRCELERFPDGELRPVVDPLRGEDVYVVQPTGPPVSDHLMELFLLLDACRRGGAQRI